MRYPHLQSSNQVFRLLLSRHPKLNFHSSFTTASSPSPPPQASTSPSSSSLRNVGIVAHIDAGKTTTTENMLFVAGEIKSIGRVDTGDTVTDFLPQERERGITINSAIIELAWKNALINLIDTPGHVDFTIEVERSCRVLDGIILVIDAVAGVQAQTKTVWKQVRRQSIPSIAFINKMDRDGASFERALLSIKSGLHANAVAIQMPIEIESTSSSSSTFLGVVDLIGMKTYHWNDTTLKPKTPILPIIAPLTATHALFKTAMTARKRMLESLAELDETFMEIYFRYEDRHIEISTEDVLSALKRQCLQGTLIPALCGASLKSKGIQPLLDSIITFLPSPLERPPVLARHCKTASLTKLISPLPSSSSPELCALAFKVAYDSARGPLVFVRIYSGVLSSKQVIFNSTRRLKERVGAILRVSADDLEAISELKAGEVGCLVGLKKTQSGDTLVIEQGPLGNYVLSGLTIPPTVFSVALEPEKSSLQDDLEKALQILCLEDPSLEVVLDKESGQTLVRGIGELHLEIVCDKLKRQFNIPVTSGRAYIAFRETLALEEDETIDLHHVYDRVIGTKRLFAGLSAIVKRKKEGEQIEEAEGVTSSPQLSYDAIKNELSVEEKAALEEAFEGSISRGICGFPVTGFNLEITALERDIHTCSGSLRACLSMLISTLLKGEHHRLLEPFMSVEIQTPSTYVGDVLSDFSLRRRGIVKEVRSEETGVSLILAQVPLATMVGYASAIRSMTQGEGSFSMEFEKYVVVEDSLLMRELTRGI